MMVMVESVLLWNLSKGSKVLLKEINQQVELLHSGPASY